MTDTQEHVYVVIITGGRDYNLIDADLVWLDEIWERFGFRIVLHGDCPTGVDRQAAAWARGLGLCDAACPAQWEYHREKYGRAGPAGPERNQRMAWACRTPMPAICLAFPGGRGTENMKKEAAAAGIEVIEAPVCELQDSIPWTK